MICLHCKEPIETLREAAGLKLCMTCGERDAKRQIAIKRSKVAPAFNKGGLQYIPEDDAAKGAFNTNQRSVTTLDAQPDYSHYGDSRATRVEQARLQDTRRIAGGKVRKPIGIFYTYAEPNGVMFYDADDPRLATATRKVMLP